MSVLHCVSLQICCKCYLQLRGRISNPSANFRLFEKLLKIRRKSSMLVLYAVFRENAIMTHSWFSKIVIFYHVAGQKLMVALQQQVMSLRSMLFATKIVFDAMIKLCIEICFLTTTFSTTTTATSLHWRSASFPSSLCWRSASFSSSLRWHSASWPRRFRRRRPTSNLNTKLKRSLGLAPKLWTSSECQD